MEISWRQNKEIPRQIYFPKGCANPSDIRAIRELLSKGEDPNMTLTLNFGYNVPRLRTALLRAAYLALFRGCGYAFVLSDAGQMIRDQLSAISNEGLTLPGVILSFPAPPLNHNRTVTVCAVEQPSALNGFCVIFRPRGYHICSAVFLPFPDEPAVDYFTRTQLLFSEKREFQLCLSPLRSEPLAMVHPNLKVPSEKLLSTENAVSMFSGLPDTKLKQKPTTLSPKRKQLP